MTPNKQIGDAEDLEFGLYTLTQDWLSTRITWERRGKVEYSLKFYSRREAEEMWREIEYDFYAREVKSER